MAQADVFIQLYNMILNNMLFKMHVIYYSCETIIVIVQMCYQEAHLATMGMRNLLRQTAHVPLVKLCAFNISYLTIIYLTVHSLYSLTLLGVK